MRSRGKDDMKLEEVLRVLAEGGQLPPEKRDYALTVPMWVFANAISSPIGSSSMVICIGSSFLSVLALARTVTCLANHD